MSRFRAMKEKIAEATIRLQLIREGLENSKSEDALGLRQRRPRVKVRPGQIEQMQSGGIPFHIPATRSYRLKNEKGATSFHFSHRAVSKVTFDSTVDGFRNSPGAARAHARYVERQDAVASLEQRLQEPSFDAAEPVQTSNQPIPNLNLEIDNDYGASNDPWLGTGLVELISPFQSGSSGLASIESSESDAGMRLLSRRELVRDRRRTLGVLLGAQDVHLAAGPVVSGLRWSASGDPIGREGAVGTSLRGGGDGSLHDAYIGRPEAVSVQPDGTRALLTNIDPDDDVRADFWSQVEQHEAVAKPDEMSFRMADNAAFWIEIAAHEDCPPELKAAIETAEPEALTRFKITSGKQMRVYLAKQPGWIPPRKARKDGSQDSGPPPFAKFHDGRGGRTQYRIVGELPDELSTPERFEILQNFTQEFEKRSLPYVAVMHAPDHHNNEANWHFHLIYYDRPAKRIDGGQIDALERQGHSSGHLVPGMWDFAVITPKRNRKNGRATPLKQNKVSDVVADSWIPMLRQSLATITNEALVRAGAERRVDHRRYDEMGIVADPQQHLGTKQAAAETRGIPTQTGCENERRQWAAIMVAADAKLERWTGKAERMLKEEADFEGQAASDEVINQRAYRRMLMIEAIQLDDMAFQLDQLIERARSRAKNVHARNAQLLQAYEADAASGTKAARQEAEFLTQEAANYLRALDQELAAELELPAQCRALATELDALANAIVAELMLPPKDNLITEGQGMMPNPSATSPGNPERPNAVKNQLLVLPQDGPPVDRIAEQAASGVTSNPAPAPPPLKTLPAMTSDGPHPTGKNEAICAGASAAEDEQSPAGLNEAARAAIAAMRGFGR